MYKFYEKLQKDIIKSVLNYKYTDNQKYIKDYMYCKDSENCYIVYKSVLIVRIPLDYTVIDLTDLNTLSDSFIKSFKDTFEDSNNLTITYEYDYINDNEVRVFKENDRRIIVDNKLLTKYFNVRDLFTVRGKFNNPVYFTTELSNTNNDLFDLMIMPIKEN